ncbi:MAG: ArnT family glycosyltransferase [Planctomycetota bacterium]|jgi:4-amino-4-deoxy-L-arabinose transferase-like glycosyltransferase
MSDSAVTGERPSNWRVHILLLLWLGVAFMSPRPGDGDHYLHGDSLHYAGIARSTLESGDLMSLQLAGEPYFKKPPLLFWMAMGMFRLGGYTTWMAELVGVISALGAIVFLYFLLRRLTDERHAFLAAAAMTFTYVFLRNAVALRFSAPITLALMLSLWAVIEGERRRGVLPLFWVGAMLGVGLKGPAGLLCLPVLLLWSLLRRRAYPFNVPLFWAGLPLLPLLILPWYFHMKEVHGEAFMEALRYEASKVAGSEGSGVVVGKYTSDLLTEYWPWLPFLLHGAWLTVRKWWRGQRDDRTSLPLAWILGVTIVLLSLNRAYSRYVVPMVPAWSLLVAVSLLSIWPRLVGRRFYRGMTWFLGVGTFLVAFTPVQLHGDRLPDVVRFHQNWLAVAGLEDDTWVLDDEVSWTQQSAAVFYADMKLHSLPFEQAVQALTESGPRTAMVRRRDKHRIPAGVDARVIDSGRDYDLVELSLAAPGG